MSDFLNFSSDKVDAFMLLVDCSGSMEDSEEDMRKGLKKYKKSFDNFVGSNSIAVSLCKFASNLRIKEFEPVNKLDISYSSENDTTALYYSINEAAKYLVDYIKKIKDKKRIFPKATFIVFSDGVSCGEDASRSSAEKTIRKLNEVGITTVFVAFGESITSEFGANMGFQSTIDVNDRKELVHFLGVELSQSCKEQSKSIKALGENFFSQAVNSNSEGFSQTSQQALEDTSWLDEI